MINLDPKIVFLVEDSVAYRIIIHRLLERNGFLVMNFDNGKDACEMLPYVIPNLIISDIEMPEMNGFEFHKFVIENYAEYDIPFVYLSTITSKKMRKKALKLGATKMLEKNISTELLEETVNQVLNLEV